MNYPDPKNNLAGDVGDVLQYHNNEAGLYDNIGLHQYTYGDLKREWQNQESAFSSYNASVTSYNSLASAYNTVYEYKQKQSLDFFRSWLEEYLFGAILLPAKPCAPYFYYSTSYLRYTFESESVFAAASGNSANTPNKLVFKD